MTISRDKLLETVQQLRNNNVDLAETPALFIWEYEEEPDIVFQLLIGIKNPENALLMNSGNNTLQ